jgi:hypothetical protein
MDTIRFEFYEKESSLMGESDHIDIFINDRSLIDIAEEIAAKNDANQYYAGLEPKDLLHELDNWEEYLSTVLDCDCGDKDCDPFWVHIDKTEESVIWHDFMFCHQDWDCSKIPTYHFDIEQYNAEVEKIRERLLHKKEK